MKNIILVISLVSFFAISCDTPGGNKSIFPVEEDSHHSESEEASNQEDHEEKAAITPIGKISSLRHTLQFTAYKTSEKKGVNGSFTNIKLYQSNESDSLVEALQNSTFEIDSRTVNTGDTVRDPKLKTFFFDNLASPIISGEFVNFENNKVKTKIKMNEVEKEFDFNYTLSDDKILIQGTIDMLKDFSANTSFDAIHKACKELHADKTWTDVNLIVTISK